MFVTILFTTQFYFINISLFIFSSFFLIFFFILIFFLISFSHFIFFVVFFTSGMTDMAMDIFIRSGLPGAFVTICCAQLLPSMLSKGIENKKMKIKITNINQISKMLLPWKSRWMLKINKKYELLFLCLKLILYAYFRIF